MKRTILRDIKKWWVGISFVFPACVFFGILILFPVLKSIYLSFTDYTILLEDISLIGLSQYSDLFRDSKFYLALKNTLIWSVFYTILSVGIGLILAIVLNTIRWISNILRLAFYYPMVLSFVVIGLLWMWMYLPDIGIINTILRTIGLKRLAVPWLGKSSTALYGIIVAASWQQAAYCMVLYLAGLAMIPVEYLEAAQIDGATHLQSFLNIVLPLLNRVTALAVVTTVLKSFKVFDLVYIMTYGGPYRASIVLPFFMYEEAFHNYRMAYGTAISVVSLIVVFPFIVFYLRHLTTREVSE